MSFLAPDFDPDIFVSYSHGDPCEGRAPLRDWTRALIRRLRHQLRSLEPEFKELKFWIDESIDPTAALTDQLKKTVSNSGVLMIVMSKHYLRSSWCKDEREWFREQIEVRPAESGRVFILRAQKTEAADWPDFLRDERGHVLPGFYFYDLQNGYPWDYPDLMAPNADFGRELLDLQIWLVARLRELRMRAAKRAQTEAAAPQPTGPRLIYLHAPPDSELARAEIDGALRSDNIVPLSAPSPAGGSLNDWRQESDRRIEMAKNCEALALLRASDSRRFDRDLILIGVDERKGISVGGQPMPCAILDMSSEGLPIKIDEYGIKRFDVNQTHWRSEFRDWLDDAREGSRGAAP